MEEGRPVQVVPEGNCQLTARDIDILYRETDRLYYEIARGCGLSDTAYWLLYEVVYEGGSALQRELGQAFCYSRQTVNSALKTLESRGLVEIGFEEGSRKCKVVCLTSQGQAFCSEKVVPAMQAEERAFRHLSSQDQAALVRLVGCYAQAIDEELECLRERGDIQERGGDE